MKKKKFLSLLIVLAMIAATVVMPMTASADGTKKTMNMGGSVIAKNDNIYYGYNDGAKKWRVLSTNGNTTQNGQTTETATYYVDGSENPITPSEGPLFVISENDFGKRAFDSGNNQMWQTDNKNSQAKEWCNEIGETYTSNGFYTAAGITTAEKAAILTTSKSDVAYSDFKATSINDKVFYLSANEAETYLTDKIFKPGGGDAVWWWWLRSPSKAFDFRVGDVKSDGSINVYNANSNSGVVASRPAFNLNLSSVLFTSAADFNGTIGDYTGKDWKLTLKDSTRSITIGNVTRSGNNVTVNYSGATTGTNAKVAYIVTNADKTEIKAYGNADASASGSINATLPQDVADDDKLFVFSEQDNGAKKTNYASELKEVTIPAAGFAVTANVNDDTMGSVTASKALANTGESVTLTATAKEGYKLVGFESDDVEKLWISGNECMFTMPENDITVTANFEAVSQTEHTVTVVSNYSQMGSASASVTTAKTGDVVTLSNTPTGGNSFVEYISGDVNIEGNTFRMLDKDVTVIAIFKADASFTPTEGYAIQAQKENDTAVLRFMWTLDKADGAYLANIGAYIIPWALFDNKEAAKPSIVLVPSPNAKDDDTFSADYINIPTSDFDTDFCAIPFINGAFFAQGLLCGNVDQYDVDQAK